MGLLSSIGRFLFGSKPKAQFRTMPTLSPEQRRLLDQFLIPYLRSKPLSPLDEASTPYTGRLTAGLSDLEQQALGGISSFVQQFAGSPIRQRVQETLLDLMQGVPTDFANYFTQSVERPLLRTFEEQVIPQINRRFGGTAFYSSERATAQDRAMRELAQALASARAEMAFRARESALQRALQAARLAPDVQVQELSVLQNALQAGAVPRQVEQAGLTAEYQEFQRRIAERNERIRQALAVLGIRPFENIAVVTPGQTGFLTALAGGVGQGFGQFLGNKLFIR